jgi:hypothetical protein
MASHVDDFLGQFQNMMNQIKPKNSVDQESDYTMTHKSQIVDSMEVLSFSLLMHAYMGFYLFLFQQPFIAMMIYQSFACGLSYSLLQYNFFHFIFHPFFQTHMQDIVLPQSLYTLFHYYILCNQYPFYVTLFINMMMYHVSNSYFHEIEHQESKKIRTFMNLIIYFAKFFYMKMIYSLFTYIK